MKKGFSYIEILITIFIISLIVISSSYTLSLMLSLERQSKWDKNLLYYLNRYTELAEFSLNKEKLNRFFTLKTIEKRDSILFILIEKKRGRIFYIYRSKIINF